MGRSCAGFRARKTSAPTPQTSVVPGAKPSITTSAAPTSSLTHSWPSVVRRSATRLSLPRFHTRKPLGFTVRNRSPSGGSTLITRAPASARITPAIEAAALPEPSSSTFKPSKIRFIMSPSEFGAAGAVQASAPMCGSNTIGRYVTLRTATLS